MADPVCEVVVQLAGDDVLAGRLWAHRRGSSESATFAYVDAYLARPDAYALDPALPLVAGQLQTPAGRPMQMEPAFAHDQAAAISQIARR